jgi:excisionase family DNA binding protein
MSALAVVAGGEPGPLLTPDQVAQRLTVSRSMAYKLIRTGALPVHRIGRLPRVAEADLVTYLTNARRGGCR